MAEIDDSGRQGQELSALRTELVQLIVNQSTIFTNWIKFAITVQGGLAAGLGVVLGWNALAKYRPLGLIIACFGIAAAVLFAKILIDILNGRCGTCLDAISR
jgi:hypothetical protein